MRLSYELALPNKLFEYAYVGLPIVASNTHKVKKYHFGYNYESGHISVFQSSRLKAYEGQKKL